MATAPYARTASKLVCFHLGSQEFGVPIDSVVETLPLRPLTRVCLTPQWVLGIINVRGDVVAVLDLAQLMAMQPTVVGEDSRILILEHGPLTAGVVVDELAELREIEVDSLAPPPSTLSSDTAELLAGLVTVHDGAALRLLDLEALFSSERITSLHSARE